MTDKELKEFGRKATYGLRYGMGVEKFMAQARHAATWMATERARIIREAEARGCRVTELHDEIIIEEPGK